MTETSTIVKFAFYKLITTKRVSDYDKQLKEILNKLNELGMDAVVEEEEEVKYSEFDSLREIVKVDLIAADMGKKPKIKKEIV